MASSRVGIFPHCPKNMVDNLLSRFLTVLVSLAAFFILLFVYTRLAGPIPFDISSVTTSKSDAFSVSGEGKVRVQPDSATVRLGVVAQAQTAEQARTALNTNINKVIEAVKALGVDEKNIKTENFNIYPEYQDARPLPAAAPDQPTSDQNRIAGYNANTNISVTVDNAEMANKILDVATVAGANQVGGVSFEVKDKNAAMNQARELAVADAKKKAEDAARIAGFRLGKIINYSEGQNGGYPPVMAMKAEDARSAAGGASNVQPGENEVVVNVTLSYEIR